MAPRRSAAAASASSILLAIVGGGLAIALSEDVRNKVLDLLFGKEEEFDYTSTTAPPVADPGGDRVDVNAREPAATGFAKAPSGAPSSFSGVTARP